MRKLSVIIAAVGIGVGCDEVKSEDVDTSGIYADISVTGNAGGSALATAVLRVGDATSTAFVELTAGDALTAADGATTLEMQDAEILEFHSYNALFDTSEAETVYTIALARDGKEAAPATTATLPAPFELTNPPSSVSGSVDTVLTWEPSGTDDAMMLTVLGDCIDPYATDLDDAGTFTIGAGTLAKSASADSSTCDVTVTLARSRAGTLDPAFGGGVALGRQTRAFNASFSE
jgi:hypothetical protein